jgi:hypothetical protein
MSITFINRTSRAAIAGRVAEWRRQPQNWNELNMLGDYHLPFGKPDRSREVALSGLITNAERRESIPARTQAPMLDRPSDDEVSRQILGVFMRHRIPASGILQRNHFFDVRDGDFQCGLNKAVANNWITIDLRNRYRYQLTEKGYAVGRMIDPVLGQPTNFVRP